MARIARSPMAVLLGVVLLMAAVAPVSAVENALPEGFHDGHGGVVDTASCRAAGWAVDPDDRFARLAVRVVVDGAPTAAGTANLFRQDLLDAGVSPDGYSHFSIDLAPYLSDAIEHSVLVEAQDAQTAEWRALNDSPRTLTCPAVVWGSHDGAVETVAAHGTCYANGWAVDPADPSTELAVRVLVDGGQVAQVTADMYRQDIVDAGIDPDGESGFHVDLVPLVPPGVVVEIRVQARDIQTEAWLDLDGTPRTILCTNLFGSHDGTAGDTDRDGCVASGWAFDADGPTGPRVRVRVRVDGRVVAEVTADRLREDVRDAGYGDGFSGFEVPLFGKVTPGRTHLVLVEARDTDNRRVWTPLADTGQEIACRAGT